MNDIRARSDIDALVFRFFSVFDNRHGRTPVLDEIVDLFAERAVIARHGDGQCDLYDAETFALPRIALLRSGELTGFHEWEETSATQVAGDIASRVSRYAKSGVHLGAPYAGTGTKFFQLGRFAPGWRIVALSWADDEIA